jgi:hypothetical protein
MSAALVTIAGLYRVVRRAEGENAGLALAAVGGGALAAAGTTTTALVQGTIALRIDDLGADGVRVWWTMYLLSTGVTLLGLLVVIGATAAASIRRRTFPRWFMVVSVLLVLLSALGACTIGYDTVGIQVVGGLALVFDSVWILLFSLFLWRHPELAD